MSIAVGEILGSYLILSDEFLELFTKFRFLVFMILSKMLFSISSIQCNLEAKNKKSCLKHRLHINEMMSCRNTIMNSNIKFFSWHVLLFCLQVTTNVVYPLFHQSLLLLPLIVESSKYTLYAQPSI